MADHPERYVTLDAEQADRVSKHINSRIAEIPGMNQSRLVERAGVSEATVRPLMAGTARNYWPSKLGQVAAGLGWTPDSIVRIADGLDPVLTHPPELEARMAQMEERMSAVEVSLGEVLSILRPEADGPA